MTSALEPVKFSRLARRGVLLGLSPGQLLTLGIGAITLVFGLYAAGSTGLALTFPVVAVCAAVSFWQLDGRPVVSWLPVVTIWLWRSSMGQLDYRHRIGRPRVTGTLALPGDGARLQQWEDAETGAAMVHDPHAATAIMAVNHPAFVLLDPAEQQRRVTGWGRVLATACRSGRIAGLQVTERTLPDSGRSLTDWWETHGNHDDTWAARTYAELIERARPTSEQHATTVSVTLDMRAASRAIRAAGGGRKGAAAVLRQEMATITAALRSADLTPTGWLTAPDLAVVLRSAYDPDTAATLDHHPEIGRDLTTAGPVAVTESWGSLRSDSAHHAVLWISEWPRSQVYPGFLAPLLLSSGVRRTLSLHYQPLRTDAAARDIRRKKTEYVSDATQRAKLGQIEDAQQSAEYRDVLQQEADLTAGHGILRTTGLITISAPDLDELETSIAAVEQAAIQASCETRRLWGQQAQAFTGSLPLGHAF
jgi:hypothetical protein